MIKVLSVIMCILMLCTVLCACGNDNVTDMASEAMSEVVSSTDGEVTDGDGMIGNETPTNDNAGGNTDTNTSDNTDSNSGDNADGGAGENATTTTSSQGMM